MPMLHDPVVRASIEARLNTLRSDSPRQWGTMTAEQMLWHLNQFLGAALGEGTMPAQKAPLPLPLMRFMLLYLPWPKSAPTNPGAVARGPDLRRGRREVRQQTSSPAFRPPFPAVRRVRSGARRPVCTDGGGSRIHSVDREAGLACGGDTR